MALDDDETNDDGLSLLTIAYDTYPHGRPSFVDEGCFGESVCMPRYATCIRDVHKNRQEHERCKTMQDGKYYWR